MRFHHSIAVLLCCLCSISIHAYSQTWDTVGCGLYKYGATVSSFAVYNDELYLGGDFFFTGEQKMVNSITRWNGKRWDSAGNGMYGHVDAMAVYNDELYAGGTFYIAGRKPAYKIAKWNGKRWDTVGKGMNHNWLRYDIKSLVVFDGELYAGGIFDSAGGKPINNIAKWNGQRWSAVGKGIGIIHFQEVLAMKVYNDQLYASTVIPGFGRDSCNVFKWDGKGWETVYSGYGSITNFAVYRNELYAGGKILTTGKYPIGNLMKWDGQKWTVIGKGFNNNGWDGNVNALIVFNNELYIAGGFDHADTLKAKNLVKWDGKRIEHAGEELYGGISGLALYHNELYVTGNFHYRLHGGPLNSIGVWHTAAK